MDSKSINKEKYITEFCGFPSNYMKSCFNMVDNNLSKKGLDVYVTSDFNIEDVDCEINLKNKSGIDYCDFISSVSRQKLSAAKCGKSDIIIQNRGIIDIYFWYQYLFKEGYINIEDYKLILECLSNDLKDVDKIFVFNNKKHIFVYGNRLGNNVFSDIIKNTDTKFNFINTDSCDSLECSSLISDQVFNGYSKKLKK